MKRERSYIFIEYKIMKLIYTIKLELAYKEM